MKPERTRRKLIFYLFLPEQKRQTKRKGGAAAL